MYSPDSSSDLFSRRASNPGEGEELEAGHALSLQHAQPNDPRVYRFLVDNYGAEILRFLNAFFDAQSASRKAPIQDLARNTFAYATANVAHFYGSASVRGWLVRIAIERVHQYQKKQLLDRLLQKRLSGLPRRLERPELEASSSPETRHAQPPVEDPIESRLWDLYALLPEKQRLLVLLRYLFAIKTSEISQILNLSTEKIVQHLHAFRDDLSDGNLESNPLHPQLRKNILRAWEGLLEDEQDQMLEIRQHLAGCPECHGYLADLERLDAATREAFRARWSPPSSGGSSLHEPVKGFHEQQVAPRSAGQAGVALRSGVWIGVAIVLFVGIAWMINSALPAQDQPAQKRTPKPAALPAPVEIEAKVISSADEGKPDRNRGNLDYNLDPRLSADGRWVVYVTNEIVDNPAVGAPGIYLFDRQTGESKSITLPDSSRYLSFSGGPPSISADGRWVVYSVYDPEVNGLVLNGERLLKPGPGILLYDRESGKTELIDHTSDGKPVQGVSTNPAISADGEWIAYWSDAQNIAESQSEPCQSFPCLDLFLYHRSSGEVQRIPIGRNSGAVRWQVNLSADGRYLALTLLADDQIARTLALHHMFDAYIYDRLTGSFTPLNTASDGTPGDDASFDPHLSADGRFVAFSSSAKNLVPGDTNGVEDVFVRDLEKGVVERVSVDSMGEQGNADSGTLTFSYLTGWSEGVSISADGRYVTFTSFASSLSDEYLLPCSNEDPPNCSLVYVHDRATGKTERVAGRVSQRAYTSPDISADGQMISYLEVRTCDQDIEEFACSEVWVYDQDTQWTNAVTRMASTHSSPEWVSSLQIMTRGSGIPAIAFSPNGQMIATGNNNGSVNLLRVEDGTLLATLQGKPESAISSLAFSPDGKMLAAGAFPGVVKVWRLSDDQLRYTLYGHPDVIPFLRFSDDGSMLVVGGENAIWIWQLKGEVFQRIANFDYPEHFVSDVALYPNKNWLAVAGSDHTVWIQEIPSGKVILRLGGQDQRISTIAFSPDGNYLAVGSHDHTVNLWDSSDLNRRINAGDKPPSLAYIYTFWHPDELRKVRFSPDGSQLLTLAADKWLRSWNLAKKSFQADLFEDVYTFSSSPTGGTLAVGEGSLVIRLWRGVTNVANPSFFQRSPLDALQIPIDTPPAPESGELKVLKFLYPTLGQPMDLYQASEAANFPLQVPAYLPPEVAFYNAYRTSAGAFLIVYDYLTPPPQSSEYASIILCERTVEMDESACGGWIGDNAVVEAVQIDRDSGIRGESVTGDWYTDRDASQNSSGKAILRWDSDASTRWLRWQTGNVVSTLYAKASADNIPFSKDDLIAIASSQSFLFEMTIYKPVSIHYLVREGDTCQGIASQFGTTIPELISLNGLTGGCEMIVEGQTLIIPLPQVRKNIVEYDLDCNGQLERLQVIGYSRSFSSGLELYTRGWNGLYKPVWHYTFDDTGDGSFMQPELIDVGGCERFIAVNFVGYDSNNDAFKVFRWDGQSMNLVLDAKGSAGSNIIPQGPLSVIPVQQRSIDPTSGACLMTTVEYGWDGRAFIELGRRSGEACNP